MGLFRRTLPAPTPEMARWGEVPYVTLQAGHVQQPDLVTWVPGTMVGDQRRHPGLQLANGVSQLQSMYEVPAPNGVPYWQVSPLRRPPVYTPVGGSPDTPAVASVAEYMATAQYAGVDLADGRGPVSPFRRLISRRVK